MDDTPTTPNPDFVWTYRGYQLKSSEFTTAMVHFFRAEVQRANVWRQRLDTTFNWAVVTTAAAISFAFTDTPGSHIAILLDMLLVTLFLYIESRRYRYYELWAYRVRLMETDFFASMLVPPFRPAADWAESLAETLLHPTFHISAWEAFGRRLRRNYLLVYVVIGAAWLAKIGIHPDTAASWEDLQQRAAIGGVPGPVVFLMGALFYAILAIISLLTFQMRHSAGEVLPRYQAQDAEDDRLPWFRPSQHRQQLLALVITQRGEQVSAKIMSDMSRGVTMLSGMGAFTKQDRPVLLCAITVTEMPRFKALVAEQDPAAFVIVTPAQEVLGLGFSPLQPKTK